MSRLCFFLLFALWTSDIKANVCEAGYYCPDTSDNTRQNACSARYHCPMNQSRPMPTRRGFYSTERGAGPRAGYTSERECGLGGYCVDGVRYDCPAGTFGNETRATNYSVCQDCFQGYVCSSAGNSRGDPEKCGIGNYCPVASVKPVKIDPGYYAVFQQSVDTAYAQNICPLGMFCQRGIAEPCVAGRYGSEQGLIDNSCSGPIAAGYYSTKEGLTTPYGEACGNVANYCPIQSTKPMSVRPGYYTVGGVDDNHRVAETICEPGGYCPGDGRRYLCNNGTFSDNYGLESKDQCIDAPKGYYVPYLGAVAPITCGSPSLYCPNTGMSAPKSVDPGFYSIDSIKQKIAHPGHYASGGMLWTCPKGRFGRTAGLSDASCSGLCSKGFFCPSGSVSQYQRACGGTNKVCPIAGLAEPLDVTDGSYTITSDSSNSTILALTDCLAGYYRSNSTTTVSTRVSAVPVMASEKQCLPCPNGFYKSHAGDGPCRACDTYTTRGGDGISCDCVRVPGGGDLAPGEALFFNWTSGACDIVPEEMIAKRQALDALRFKNDTVLAATKVQECEPGYYCILGVRRPCREGTYGSYFRETRAECSGNCVEGYYCPQKSTKARQIMCGNDPKLFCPANSSEPLFVTDPGYYTITPDGFTDKYPRSAQLPCPAGYYCVGGIKAKCAAGRYGILSNYTNDQCHGPCRRGFLCNEGSTNDTAQVCGGPDRICPEGSFEPILVPDGYYSIHTGANADETHFFDPNGLSSSAMLPCNPGYFCQKGIQRKCPDFTFGFRYFQSSPKCDGQIAPGCYAPIHSKPYLVDCPFQCGGNHVYCPATGRETKPTFVSPGHYSIGINETRRTGQRKCPAGTYCLKGIQYICPAGMYQSTPGAEGRCSYNCPPGHECPAGSAMPVPCTSGYYSVGRASTCTPCPGTISSTMNYAAHLKQHCFNDRRCCARY